MSISPLESEHQLPPPTQENHQIHRNLQNHQNHQNHQRNARSSSNAEELYLESYAFTTAAAIVGSVDRKIFVSLRDGRYVFGILRTFDQFANLVLQDTWERIYLPSTGEKDKWERFAEAPRGVFMVRGENVVMLGELDIDREDLHLYEREQIPFEEAEREFKAIQRHRISEEHAKVKRYLKRGLVHDFHKADLY